MPLKTIAIGLNILLLILCLGFFIGHGSPKSLMLHADRIRAHVLCRGPCKLAETMLSNELTLTVDVEIYPTIALGMLGLCLTSCICMSCYRNLATIEQY